ncbi:DUF1616 domain-containing protein [Halomicrococcus gelatinilyticus]|uniref:DUF1616 domain-containing protein n=1 Tax=Halomicrococcus gelatinilyticus TaxID=1702103 RepID=UPI002E13986A
MSTNSRWWFADLLVVLLLTAVGGYVAYADFGGRLRVAVVMPLAVLLPGYALLSALYPSAGAAGTSRTFGTGEADAGYALGGPERLALSVALSVAIVPLVAAATNFTPWGIREHPVIIGVAGVTAALTLLAFVRQLRVPPQDRYLPGVPELLFTPTGRGDDGSLQMLNVAILLSFLLVVSTAGYAAFNPPQGEQFTEFSVDTKAVDSDVESMYQRSFPAGESSELTVVVGNREEERTEYTVVAMLQRVEDGTVVEQQRLTERSVTVDDGETMRVPLTVEPSMTGDDLRIRLLLYRGAPSDDPYRTARLWVSVGSDPQRSRLADGDGGGSDNGDGGEDASATTTPESTTDSTSGTTTTAGGTTSTTDPTSTTSTTSTSTTTPGTTSTTAGTTSTASGTTSTTTDTSTATTTQSPDTTPTTTDDGGLFPHYSPEGLDG